MSSRSIILIIGCFWAVVPVCICCDNTASAVTAGSQMPAFTVHAEKSDLLESTSLQGKVIIITYETRESKDSNNDFKEKITEYYSSAESNRDALCIVPVVNCFKYFWPIKGYCIREVQKSSKKTAFKLYIDRDGAMFDAFGVKDNVSNVFIIDRLGIVRFVKKGKLDDKENIEVLELIESLLHD